MTVARVTASESRVSKTFGPISQPLPWLLLSRLSLCVLYFPFSGPFSGSFCLCSGCLFATAHCVCCCPVALPSKAVTNHSLAPLLLSSTFPILWLSKLPGHFPVPLLKGLWAALLWPQLPLLFLLPAQPIYKNDSSRKAFCWAQYCNHGIGRGSLQWEGRKYSMEGVSCTAHEGAELPAHVLR